MEINGLLKTTLLDYPGHLAATVFLGGCNLRCPFCHNSEIVNKTSSVITENELLQFLQKRQNILEGICITGGEPTLYNDLYLLLKKIKALKYKIKLDTNGSNPSFIEDAIKNNLVDYVAMDIKNSKNKYQLTSGTNDINIANIEKSIRYLIQSPVKYEFRTTVVKEFHQAEDFKSIGMWLQGAKSYFLQQYTVSNQQLSPQKFTAYSINELNYFKDLLTSYIDNVNIRGI